ncbi:unnamed protein product [Zymoseptoria tritici ST99CH_1A5]|uniref:Vesicle-mediated transporter Vid24 n=1 Tax=Zymoseptoria tritici ST99CH_1A5 TaxID=1276529 RepID=A0A1Y6L6Z7_ZYMTR|nr:unnamed protein product [Zymoseptoria tritici ST99CH_1A5]
MPTPSEHTVSAVLPLDIAGPLRAAFTGCPPEDIREQIAQSEEQVERTDTPQPLADAESPPSDGSDDGTTTVQETATGREPDIASQISSEVAEIPAKGEHIEDVTSLTEAPSPPATSPDPVSDSDSRLVQHMSSAVISSGISSPQYLHFPELDRDRQTSYNSTTSFLRPGSKFRGTQQSDRQVYDVQVEIKDVDMAESFLCGYLRIQGLTDDHPTLTTFFEGEIIGPKYLFKTDHPSWGSSEKVDMQHWARFPAWRPLAKSAKSANFSLNKFEQREHLFMRWKEYFLVPDHKVKTITGASFEGFYYICFNQCSGTVSGIYFHAKSEKYQQLELRHVEDKGCMPAMEFR